MLAIKSELHILHSILDCIKNKSKFLCHVLGSCIIVRCLFQCRDDYNYTESDDSVLQSVITRSEVVIGTRFTGYGDSVKNSIGTLIHVWMYGCMDAWMHGCMHEWKHGWMHARMPVCMDECMRACVNGCMHAWVYACVIFVFYL